MHHLQNQQCGTSYSVKFGKAFDKLKGRKLHRKNPPWKAVLAFAVIGLIPLVHV